MATTSTFDLPKATSFNGLVITTTTGTLTIANGKTATISNTLTFTGTDASSVNFGAGGTVVYTTGAVTSIAGTANEITASAATGSVTLSLPTSLTFTGKTVTGGTFASLISVSVLGSVTGASGSIAMDGSTFNFQSWNGGQIGWMSGGTATSGSFDTALKRASAGCVQATDGSSGFGFMKAKLQTSVNATTGLSAGALAATTNASIVVYDGAGQAYRIPCII